jgi:hypothetical protein
MVGPRSYFARMNENRGDTNWLTEDQLLEGTKEFFKSNDYSNMEYNKILSQGGRIFHLQLWQLKQPHIMKIRKSI